MSGFGEKNMFARAFTVSLAALLGFGILASSAEADHRKKHRRVKVYDNYYSGPDVVRGVPGLRLFFGDYALTEEEFDALYGSDREFDEGYYEPEPAPVKRKKKTAVKPAIASPKKAAPAKNLSTASTDAARKPVAKPESAAAAKPAPAAAALTCDKATSIVGGYGFAGVKAETCKGKVYAFNATRDGKSFAIKVDSTSGELTEVKKLP